MRTKVLSEEHLRSLRSHPAAYRAARRLRFAVGGLLPPASLPGVPGRIHRNDFMLDRTENVDRYANSGRAVLEVLDSALSRVDVSRGGIRRWLDFGCGYGRVVRFLVQDISPDSVWVTDTLPEAVRFCAKEFGVHPIFDFRQLPEEGGFDFIYAISVFTHLPLADADTVAGLLVSCLAPGGLVLFTTHGPQTLASTWRYGPEFAEKQADIQTSLAENGACYLPYAYRSDGKYGVAWHLEPYVCSMIERSSEVPLRLVDYNAGGLENHQDVYVYQRAR